MENDKLVRLSDVIAFVNDERNQFDLEYEPYLEMFKQQLDSIPAVDAVEVVRCMECELWNDWDSAGHKELGNFVCSCAHWSNEDGYVVYTAPDDYCKYGELKAEEALWGAEHG